MIDTLTFDEIVAGYRAMTDHSSKTTEKSIPKILNLLNLHS
jgi:hypothetical protein